MRAFLTILVCVFVATPCQARIIYVDADAPGADNGSSWEDAYKFLQDALAKGDSHAEIRVAEGVYKPDHGGRYITRGDRIATFRLGSLVVVKGGYAGTGHSDPNARDIDAYKTILSGDLNGDDAPYFAVRADNSFHVVTVKHREHAAIDGLTIIGGNANGSGENACGGGIYSDQAWDLTVTGCTIRENFAVYEGGGMYNENESPKLLDCRFMDNCAHGEGGGFANRGGSPILEECEFTSNLSNNGGAIFSIGGDISLTECTFSSNCAGEGGAISYNTSNGTVRQCIFELNWAPGGMGGAMANWASSPNITNCMFRVNEGREGAGMANLDGSHPTIIGCTFAENYAGECGGGMVNVGSSPSITQCIFSRNIAGPAQYGGEGGAVFNGWGSSATITNCTFVDNCVRTDQTQGYGGRGDAIYNERYNITRVHNCIFWDHTPGATNNEIYGSPVIAYCDVSGGWPGEGNIDADPCFADPEKSDYHLKSQAGRWDAKEGRWVIDDVTSPCIDAGDPMSPIGLEPFPNGGIINMGAYGGTGEASKSYFGEPVCETIVAGDINGDCIVDFKDFALMALHWLAYNSG